MKRVRQISSNDEDPLNKSRGLGWILTAFFIVADVTGASIAVVPAAIVKCCM